MTRAGHGGRVGRRSVLAGLAGAAGLALSPSRIGAVGPFGPRAKLEIDGAKEVVVGDDGTVAYVATTDGFASVDVADPSTPSVLARIEDVTGQDLPGRIDAIWDVTVDGDRLVVCGPAVPIVDSAAKGIAVFDVSDPADPQRIGVAATTHGIHNAHLEGDVVYLTGTAARGRPVVLYDVADGTPTEIGSFSPAAHGDWHPQTIHDVYVVEDTLYACYWDLGTWVVDVSDPTDPQPRLRVGFDLDTNLGSGQAELPGNAHYAQPNAAETVLAVGKEAWDDEETALETPLGGIELWDISDRSSPSREIVIPPPSEAVAQPTGTAHNFGWQGDRLYVSWNAGGVEVYEVPSAAEPGRLAGWRDHGRGSFWTAKPIHDGFVGTTTLTFDQEGPQPGLFTFPEPGGDDPAPARTREPLAPADYTVFGGSEPSASRDPTTEPARSATVTEASESEAGSPRATIPGFGAVATLGAGGLAGWWLWRRRRDD